MNLPESVNWIPIEEMKNHVHGEYLCLLHFPNDSYREDSSENYSVQPRMFTYKKYEDGSREAVFLNDKAAENVVAFMSPRFFPYYAGVSYDYENNEKDPKGHKYKKLNKENRKLKEENKNLKDENKRLKKNYNQKIKPYKLI